MEYVGIDLHKKQKQICLRRFSEGLDTVDLLGSRVVLRFVHNCRTQRQCWEQLTNCQTLGRLQAPRHMMSGM